MEPRMKHAIRTAVSALMILCLITAPAMGAGTGEGMTVEAETGVMAGNTRVAGSGGREWVEGFQQAGSDSFAAEFTIAQEGFYDIAVIQASQGGHKENPVLLDGENIGTAITDETRFGKSVLEHIYLAEGTHTLGLGTSWGYVKVDAFELTPSKALPEDLYTIPEKMSVGKATPEARRLYDWMRENYGKKIISGQQCDGGMLGMENQAIWRATGGSYPAILGLDMMEYSLSRVEHGGESDKAVPQAIDYWNKGGIVSFCWHWNAPSPYLKNPWYSGFYTQYTSFNLEKVMNGKDEAGFKLLNQDIDAIAAQLLRLKEAGVPVLWRPLHEASGGWFWWGASGAEAYLKLYRLMYDRLTNVHGLNNLIWIWNGQDAAWYPGDDMVDMIGTDLYPGKHVHDTQQAAFLKCAGYTDSRKIILLSECGCVPSTVKCLKDNVMWSSWAVWCYEFVQVKGQYNGEYTSPELLKQFYEQDHVITLKDVPLLGRTPVEEEAPAEDGGLTWSFAEGVCTGAAQPAGDHVDIRGNAEGDTVTLTISVPEDGTYLLTILQSGIGGYKENYLSIDGETLGNTIVQGEAEEACEFGPVTLTAGEHSVKITAFWGWVSLKNLSLTPVTE